MLFRSQISGRIGEPLRLKGTLGQQVEQISSAVMLSAAKNRPLTEESLREQLGRLGGTPFHLGQLSLDLPDPVILPLSELNRLRRELVSRLTADGPKRKHSMECLPVREAQLPKLLAPILAQRTLRHSAKSRNVPTEIKISVLCRDPVQAEALLDEKPDLIYLDFEDLRRFGPAVESIRKKSEVPVYLATPRIQKAEIGIAHV